MPMIDRMPGLPQPLRAYRFLGLDLRHRPPAKEAFACCPWCGSDGKFSVNAATGQWGCWRCNEGIDNGKPQRGGGINTFCQLLWRKSIDRTTEADYRELARQRGYLRADTLIRWGLARSILSGEWLLPAHREDDPNRMVCYVYRRVGDRWSMQLPPSLRHHLLGVPLLDRGKSTIYLCEGIWDAMSLWEALGMARRDGGGLACTSNFEASLLADASVLGIPGATVFFPAWAKLFSGKRVVLCCQNDHQRPSPGGSQIPSASWTGMRRVAGMLLSLSQPPESISVLRWGESGYTKHLPHGFDIRDALREGESPSRRVSLLSGLLDKVEPIPDSWRVPLSEPITISPGEIPCNSWRDLRAAWIKAMKWGEGLEGALVCMLATVLSTPFGGSQIWFKIIGPPACGKTTLAEAISVNKRYVCAKSTQRGFHSGTKADKNGEEDYSLLKLAAGKTLVTKDGDTLRCAPNKQQILAEGRDIYDGVSRTHYRHGLNHDYEGIRMTWILCGTSRLREIDESELGQRFLDWVIVDSIDDEEEMDICWRAMSRTLQSCTKIADGKLETRYSQDMSRAMGMTGGYVEYLRGTGSELVMRMGERERYSIIGLPMQRYIQELARFVAHFRARPGKSQRDEADREMSTRLGEQLLRLAIYITVVLGKSAADEQVMGLLRKVAIDTGRGLSMEIAKRIAASRHGISASSLESVLHCEPAALYGMLRYLRGLKLIQYNQRKNSSGSRVWQNLFILTRKGRELWESVYAGSYEQYRESLLAGK